MDILQNIRNGNLEFVLKNVQQQIRLHPEDIKQRILLFQIQVLRGDWDKAGTQLDIIKDLDQSVRFMVQTYQHVLICEKIRQDVFQGVRKPMIFGEPEPWIALMLEALRLDVVGEHDKATILRTDAFTQASACAGYIDGRPFSWFADADSRLGPVLEVIVNGQYYWAPFVRFKQINLMAPTDLRDFAWLPAEFVWSNGGEAIGFIPSRYSGSELSGDSFIQMSRRTEWQQVSTDTFYGLGQKIFTTDQYDCPLLDIRKIQFNNEVE